MILLLHIIYYTLIFFSFRQGDKELVNEECGHLMKTKPVGIDEGGVCMGISVLDTAFLVDI